MSQKWEITYTTDHCRSVQTIVVVAESFTDAVLQGARELPASCFVGSDGSSAILSVKMVEN